MVPGYIRVRVAERVFKASNDGYNLSKLYAVTEEHTDSYYSCLILIRDSEQNVFGALLDTVPCLSSDDYLGGHDSLVFRLSGDRPQSYKSTGANDCILLCRDDYMTIGAQGDGPALYLD